MTNTLGSSSWIGQICFSSIPGLNDEQRVKAHQALLKSYIEVQQVLDQPTKEKDGYGYKYADLNAVLIQIQKAIDDKDIAYIQQPILEGGKTGTHNYLINSQGAIFDFGSYVLDIGGTRPQDAGSALTYARRYSISCLFGIASEDDDDAERFNSKPDFMTPKQLKGLTVAYGKKRRDLIEVYAMAMSGDELAKQVIKDKSNPVKVKIAIKSINDMYKLTKNIKDESEHEETEPPKSKEEKVDEAVKKITDPNKDKEVKTTEAQDDLIKQLVDGPDPAAKSKKNDDPFAGIVGK